ncbi:MAG: sulfatase [Kiritimatiellales bacterium]
MKHNQISRSVAFSLVALSATKGLSAATLSEEKKPNVIFIYTDDQDFDKIGCYGGKVLTPNMDRIAEEGVRFTRGYVTTSVCTPSRYSAMTGQYAGRNEYLQQKYAGSSDPVMMAWNLKLQPGERTIAETLKENGYATGMVGKWMIGFPKMDPVSPDANPNDPSVQAVLQRNYRRGQEHIRSVGGFDYVEGVYITNPMGMELPDSFKVHNQEWLTASALNFIDANQARPFFLYFATTMPHNPDLLESMHADPRITPAGFLDQVPHVQPDRDSVIRRTQRAGYPLSQWAGLTWLDDGIGAILDRLDELHLSENTIIIFASDNLSHDYGKLTCYEYGTRVPFMVRWKGKISPAVSGEIVANIDIAATILDLCGLSTSAMKTDGRSFAPLLRSDSKGWRDSLYLESAYARAVVTKQWKYVAVRFPKELQQKLDSGEVTQMPQTGDFLDHGHVFYECDRKFPGYFDRDQLYDLENDPYEQHNLAGDPEYAPVLKQMKEKLTQACEDMPHAFGEFKQIEENHE